MSFMFYDLTFFALFSIAITWFLIAKRKKIGREGPIFLYRTKIGIKIIDKIGKNFAWLLKPMSYLVILFGYLMMIIMIYLLFQLVGIFMTPEYVKLIKIPPLMPFVPYLSNIFKVTWLPPLYFTYWIIITAVIAFAHEGFHGIYSRLYKIKVKSTGFGFLGPIPTFFVEPDDRQMKRAKIHDQLSISSAGVFGNFIASILFLIILFLFFTSAYAPAGALFNTYSYSTIPVTMLSNATIGTEQIKLDGINMTQIKLDGKDYFVWDQHLATASNYSEGYINIYQDLPAINAKLSGAISKINGEIIKSHDDLNKTISKYKPGEKIILETKNETQTTEYTIVLGEDYAIKGRAVLGIGVLQQDNTAVKAAIYKMIGSFKNPTVYYEAKAKSQSGKEFTEFIYYLLWWLLLVNIGVALFNMLPLVIADGGRFWYLTFFAITKSDKFSKAALKISSAIILALFILLMILWAIGMI